MRLLTDIKDTMTEEQRSTMLEIILDNEDVHSMSFNDGTGLGDGSIAVNITRIDGNLFSYYIEQDGELTFTFNTGAEK